MNIIDELANLTTGHELRAWEKGEKTNGRELERGDLEALLKEHTVRVLEHLAAKAGDVRGMLPDAFDLGVAAHATATFAGETFHALCTRKGEAVLDLCAKRLAPVVGALIGQGQTFRMRVCEPEPVVGAWRAHQANGIVGELREWFGRFDEDMRVLDEGDQPVQSLASHAIREKHIPELRRIVAAHVQPDEPIADAIQAEEARRAQQWAGDEAT